MSAVPIEQLELRAMEERREIHATAEELKGKIAETKEKLNVVRRVRQHPLAVAIAIGAASLLIGTFIVRRLKR